MYCSKHLKNTVSMSNNNIYITCIFYAGLENRECKFFSFSTSVYTDFEFDGKCDTFVATNEILLSTYRKRNRKNGRHLVNVWIG